MSELALKLLGTPKVTQAGEPVIGFRSVKARALLFYVVANDRPTARTKLAGLFWGDLPDANASANLRKTLTNLRHLVGSHLTITRESVGLNEASFPQLDVTEFEEALKSEEPTRWELAVTLYQGDFLEGFYVAGAPAFETWLLAERYRLREMLLVGLHNLAQHYASSRQYSQAIHHTQRLLTLEPLRENIHRLLMSLFARSGQRARALVQYEACVQVLAEELDTEPGPETTDLFHRIEAGALDTTVSTNIPPHNLPAATTSFVGREAELERIKKWVGEGNDRLLSIVGPGGVGKTRLALHAAWAALPRFAHGAWFIPLTSLAVANNLATAVAATLGITFFGQASPEAQVVRFLRRRQLLLVFDNAEHLISQSLADFLMTILSQAAGVKIVVSSRQRLMMQAEQVLNLLGLAYPEEETAVTASTYPAGQLFLERSHNHGVVLEPEPPVNMAVHHLCQLVEGLPLALELAAAWTRMLSLPAINAEIERKISFLAANMHDVPPRHRSIRAVFDTSWQLLDDAERLLMCRLSYFRGGFGQEAAAKVTGATPVQLQALAAKSWLRSLGDGRYQIHELIRQYATEKLAQQPTAAEQVARGHGRFFANFLAEREEMIQGADYQRAKDEIQADIENVHQAWDWLVAHHSLDEIARAAETLHYYYINTQGLFAEATHRFQTAADKILEVNQSERAEQLAGRLWLQAAVNRRMLGQLDEAARLAQQSLAIFYRHELPKDIARASGTLSVIRLQQSEKEAALALAETAVNLARELDDPITLCLCLNNLSYVLSYNNALEEAIASAEESAALARQIAYPHGVLSATNMLGVYYEQTGEIEKAEAVFRALVDRCRETATRSRLAQAVNNLGALHKKRGELDKALPLLQEAASLYEAVGQTHYATTVQVMLGEVALAQGDVDQASRLCWQALRAAQEIEMSALTLDVLALHADLLRAQSDYNAATALLVFVLHQPSGFGDRREKAHQSLQALRQMMPPEAFAAAKEQGSMWTLNEAVAEALRQGDTAVSGLNFAGLAAGIFIMYITAFLVKF